MSDLSGFGLLGVSVCAGVFVVVAKRGEQVREVVVVKGVVGVAALATDFDEVQLTQEPKLVGGRALGHAGERGELLDGPLPVHQRPEQLQAACRGEPADGLGKAFGIASRERAVRASVSSGICHSGRRLPVKTRS